MSEIDRATRFGHPIEPCTCRLLALIEYDTSMPGRSVFHISTSYIFSCTSRALGSAVMLFTTFSLQLVYLYNLLPLLVKAKPYLSRITSITTIVFPHVMSPICKTFARQILQGYNYSRQNTWTNSHRFLPAQKCEGASMIAITHKIEGEQRHAHMHAKIYEGESSQARTHKIISSDNH